MRLLLLGASVRAAAQSARRAGLEPFGIDLFADRDLQACGPGLAADPAGYPGSLADAAALAPPGPWLYTGAVENAPGLIDRLSQVRPLLGNGPNTLAVRDPEQLQACLHDAGQASLAVRRSADGLPRDGSWLAKPVRSGGGRGVFRLTADAAPLGAEAYYYQRHVEGQALGALGLARRDGSACELIGLTAALAGRPGAAFAYRGSVGPVHVSPAVRVVVQAILRTLASRFGLVGLFGVDLIVTPGGIPFVLEVNPRYTASVEVLEQATGRSLLAEHVRACDPSAEVPLPPRRADRPAVVGKRIVFAPGPCRAPALDDWRPVRDAWDLPTLADVPSAGTVFEPGDPVLTVLESAPTLARCLARLDERQADWLARLQRPPWRGAL